MATAKKTSFSDAFVTLAGLDVAFDQVAKDGAPTSAAVYIFAIGNGYTLKAEWSEEIPDPAAPPADTRPQPVQANAAPIVTPVTPEVLQPDGIVNDTPQAGA